MDYLKKLTTIFSFEKFKNWEYWPSYMFYLPVVPYAFFLAVKSRSFGFFSAVNSAMEGSGNGLESKYNTLKLLPKKYRPKTIYIKANDNLLNILSKLSNKRINFPLIVKPDIGFRGLLVKKINSENELFKYLNKYNSINLMIQEFIDLKNECGILYYKIPGEKTGIITSVTLKKYLTVIGDGKSSIKELITNNTRSKVYTKLISELNKQKLNSIPDNNLEIVLNIIGNHSKGTQFIDGNNLISKELTNFLDNLSNSINGWNYGRLDIKYNNFDELIKGKNLKIIEINGIISEPTHIYDKSKSSYFKVLKTIKEHWKIVYTIGVKNKKLNNAEFSDLKYLFRLYLNYKKYLKKVNNLSVNS